MKQLFLLLTFLLASSLYAYTPEQQAMHDAILAQIAGAQFADNQPTRSLLSFGAKGDGKKDCKPAFDKAMKAAAKSKTGMHLVVPAGTYRLCGPIHLVSNLCLELQEGAVLKFDSKPDYYLPMVRTSWEGTFCQNFSPFIYGFCLENVAIIGKGIIDGDAADTFAQWRKDQKPDQQLIRQYDHQETPVPERNFGKDHLLRPHLLQLFGCKRVTLSDFFMTNSPFWCLHLLKCENVICRALRYDAKLVNNDGIDPEMTSNLLIEDILFDNGDDNVAIKAGRDNDGWGGQGQAFSDPRLLSLYVPSPSENIIVRHCHFKGLHGVVIGSEMSAGVRNVFVEDCTYSGYLKRALFIKTNPNRGGFVHDIYFRNCEFDEVEDLFYITSMYAGEGLDDNHFSDVHDIHVEDIRCNKVNNAAIVLQGTEAKPLSNISFRNVVVKECKIGFSSMNTEPVVLQNCHIGGQVTSAPSTASKKDKVFDKPIQNL